MMRILFLGFLVCTATVLDVVTAQVRNGTVNRTYFSGYDVTDLGKYFSNVIRFYGNVYIHYDFGRFGSQQSEMLTPALNETFAFQFITQEKNGLIWFDNRQDLKMYLAIQDGYLMCYIREGSRKVQSIKLWSNSISKVNDWNYHIFRMDKFGRKLNFYIDEEYIRQLTTIKEIQLMGKGSVYFGGIPSNFTDAVVTHRFNGGISKILYVKQLPGLEVRVSLMQYISQTSQKGIEIITPRGGIWTSTTTEASPQKTITINLLTAISFLKRYKLQIQGYLDFRSGGTISLKFRTLQQKGFLMMIKKTGPSNHFFLAFEIYDGNLYLIVDLGAQTRRLLISENVNNGMIQKLKLDFVNSKIDIFLNDIQKTLELTHEELNKAYFNGGIHIGGFPKDFKSWHIWSTEYDGFLGCIRDINLQNINTDMRGPIRTYPSTKYLSTSCISMNRYCDSNPCHHGACTNGVDRYFCDCAGTKYTGPMCNDLALVGGFQRNQYLTYYYSARQKSRNNEVSLRFKSFQLNSFLFQTVSSISGDYFRCELENWRIKVTIKVNGQRAQKFYVGSGLNRNTWHNLYIKRRGNYLELTIDDEQAAKYIIQGENFYLRFDKIYLGGVGDSGVSLTDVQPSYIGLMQSVYWDKIDLFAKLKQLPSSAAKIIWMSNDSGMNRFIYRPVAYTTYDVFSKLAPLQTGMDIKIMFNFRTKDNSGIILYSKGTGSKFIAMELVNGYVNFHFNNGKTTRSVSMRTPARVGDNKWHMFKLQEINKGGAWYYRVTVDKTFQDIRIPGDQKLELTGNLYIGGLPMNMLKGSSISSVIQSNHGFIGSVASIDLNGQSPDLISSASDKDSVLSSSKDFDVCRADSCSNGGTCIPAIPRFRCSCNMTGYNGDTCSEFAVIGGFKGNQFITYHYTTKQRSKNNDVSLRFKSFQPNSFLFQTVSSTSDDYLRCELDNGRIKVTVKVKGQREQKFYVGSSLNRNTWHNLYIKRRGNYLELTIDNEQAAKYIIQGENFYLRFDKIYLGGVGDSGVSLTDVQHSYIGLMQSVYWDKIDLFAKLKQLPSSAAKIIWMSNDSEMNRFIYRPVAYTTYDVFSKLAPLQTGMDIKIMFNFRTKDNSGIILYSKGTGSKFIAMELVNGYVNFHFNNGKTTRSVSMRTPARVGDNEWHMFKLQEINKGGAWYYRVTVDKTFQDIRIPGDQKLELTGNLYIGGLPMNMLKGSSISTVIQSNHGFIGSVASIDLNGQSPDLISSASDKDSVLSSSKDFDVCRADSCSNGGTCIPGIPRFRCNCNMTGYNGDTCSEFAVIGGFKGNQFITYHYTTKQRSKNNDVSLRFKSFQPNSFLFQTVSSISDDYLRCELDNGRIKVTVKVKGQREQVLFYVGSSLSNNSWNYLYIKRRGKYLELAINKETPIKYIIQGENFDLRFDKIYLGGIGDSGVSLTDVQSSYIGLMQSVYWDKLDLFAKLKQLPSSAAKIIWMSNESEMNRFIYHPVAYTTYDVFSKLAPLQNDVDLKLMFNFRTKDNSGIILYSNGTGNKFIAMELVDGYVNFRFNNGKVTRSVVATTQSEVDDNKWHMLKLEEIQKGGSWYFRVMVDKTIQDIRIPGGQKLDLTGNLYIGGLPVDMLKGSSVYSVLKSNHGFIGSVASANFNGQLPDLMASASDKNSVLGSSTEFDGCTTDSCSNGGTCIPGIPKFTCNCNTTGYIGDTCADYPVGVYFNSNFEDDLLGVIKYRLTKANSEYDQIAFGFMTFEKDGVLMRIESANSKEYITFRLKSGYLIAQYNTGSGIQTLRFNSTKFNDGLYHTVQFIRTPTGGFLHVDGTQLISKYEVPHSTFDQVQYIYIGGRLDNNFNIVKPFTGIIGGVYYNEYRVLDLGKSAIGARWIGDYRTITTGKSGFILSKKQLPTAPPRNPLPPSSGPYIIPIGIGGGGVVVPNTSKRIVAVGNVGSVSGGGGIFIGPNDNGGAITGALTGVAGSDIPIFINTKEGPRAGVVVGNVLGILAFLTSLIWAFYGLKPGKCTIKAGKRKIMSFKTTSPTVLTSAAVTGALHDGSGNGIGAGSTKVIFVNGGGSRDISGDGVDSGSVFTEFQANSAAAAVSGGIAYSIEHDINMDGGYGMSGVKYSSTAKLLDSDGVSYQTGGRSAVMSHHTNSVSTKDDIAVFNKFTFKADTEAHCNHYGTGGGMYGKEYSSTLQDVTNKHRNETVTGSGGCTKVVFVKGSDNRDISCDGVDGGSVFTVFNGDSAATTGSGGIGYSLENDSSMDGGYGMSNAKYSSTAKLIDSDGNGVSYGIDNRSAFMAFHGQNDFINTESGGLVDNGLQNGAGCEMYGKSYSSTHQAVNNKHWDETYGYSSSYKTAGNSLSSLNSYSSSIMVGSQSAKASGEPTTADYDFASGTGTMNIEDIIGELNTVQSSCQVDNEERYLIENEAQQIMKNRSPGMTGDREKGYTVSCVGASSQSGMSNIEHSTTQNIINTQMKEIQQYNSSYNTSDQLSSLSTSYSSSSVIEGQPATIPGESTTADYDFASGMGTMIETGYDFDIMNSNTTVQSSQQIDKVRTFHVNNYQGTEKTMMYTADGTISSGIKGGVVNVDCCIINNDEHTVITGSTNCPPQFWNMQSGELIKTMRGAQMGSSNLHLACNGQLLVSTINEDLDINKFSERKGVTAKRLQIWDVLTGNPLDMGVGEVCSALCVMSDPDKVVFGRSDKCGNSTSIVTWDVVGNQKIKEIIYDAPVGNNDYISFIALSQDDRYCVAGFVNSSDHFAEFVVLDMKSHVLTTKDATTLRLDAYPECTVILLHYNVCTGSRTGDIIIWNLRTGHVDRRLSASGTHAHSGEVRDLTLSKDSKYLVSAAADNTVKVWDMGTEKVVRNFSQLTDEVTFLTTGDHGLYKIIPGLLKQNPKVWCSTISDDNTIIVAGSRNGTIRLWQHETGDEICVFNTGVNIFNITMSKDKEIIVALGDKFRSRKLIMLQVIKPKYHHQNIIN